MSDLEEAEARLCRLLHPSSGYSHAENILARLTVLESVMSYRDVVMMLDGETCE